MDRDDWVSGCRRFDVKGVRVGGRGRKNTISTVPYTILSQILFNFNDKMELLY